MMEQPVLSLIEETLVVIVVKLLELDMHVKELVMDCKSMEKLMTTVVDTQKCCIKNCPPDIYALVNHNQLAKQIWDRVNLLMQGTELSYQERECKLYNEFDKFASIKVQVNTKFLNGLQPEWSKFVTDVKLAKSTYNTNYDQLYAYLSQHKGHANEVRLMRERYPDPLALVVNHHYISSYPNNNSQYNTSEYQQQLSLTSPQTYSSQPQSQSYQAPHHQQQYQASINPGLAVPSFLHGDDPIASMNKAMAFLSTTIASLFPTTNNQLKSSSNPRNQATVQDSRVIGEGHMARQCTQPKRPRNSAWFKEKLMLVEAQESGQVLDEEQLAYLADLGFSVGQDCNTPKRRYAAEYNIGGGPNGFKPRTGLSNPIDIFNALALTNTW
ncbi:hypothetical protein Tco_0491196 [Tanacetum coccineum]